MAATAMATSYQGASFLGSLQPASSLDLHRKASFQRDAPLQICCNSNAGPLGKSVRLSSSSFHSNLLSTAGARISRGTSSRNATTRCGMLDAEELVRSRKVRPISYKDVRKALTAEGEGNAYTLLDVRPEWEHSRSHSSSSLHVPLFVEHDGTDIGTLIAKWFALGYGGLWMGLRHTKVNKDFLNEVKKVAPKEQRLLVSCGDGLRSLLAAEVLYNAGYRNLAWLENGFRFVEQKDLPDLVGDTKIKYASAGGLAAILLKTVDSFQSSQEATS